MGWLSTYMQIISAEGGINDKTLKDTFLKDGTLVLGEIKVITKARILKVS